MGRPKKENDIHTEHVFERIPHLKKMYEEKENDRRRRQNERQINEIQRAISITGAAIGKFGSEAAFGQKISNAQMKLAQVTDAEAKISGVSGNNIIIEQGAFVVNVDTTGATNQDEKADIITQRIQETFAILAKELANK